ncbi:MAG: phage tail sheath C-terminal domain-containing protein [Enterocloster sp.]
MLGDVLKAECPSDPDERINKGEFILVFDGEKYKVGRGVNSLTTFTKEKTEDVRKIKIVEGMDSYQDDIRNTFTDSYVGKYVNDYDNKQLFVAAVRAYLGRTRRGGAGCQL